MTADSPRTCTFTDGHAGNVRQALALARALGRVADEIVLLPRAPWRWFAPRRLPGASQSFGPAFQTAWNTPPALAIGCGRQAALATRLLRERGSRTVQILDPRLDPSHWDLVIAPAHDGLAGPNVLTLLGSLNPVDDAWLSDARTAFPSFAALPSPLTALLIGGDSAHYAFDIDAFARLTTTLDDAMGAGSLLITASRRTPADVAQALRARYASRADTLLWCDPSDGPNPYAGLLACADRIVCTPESVNMLSEACATTVPVYVFEPARVSGRPRLFLDALLERGRIRALTAAISPFDVEPLRETARIAAEVRARLSL
ncbi:MULTISPECIES: mitochondrial fission ELM1 family protein [unclassified Pseudoxanthomonas]|uniref:mitochondrial fission ELM1 family protein n=1 Tax=unclassified Pseudoxanthomonas TaxID=2645906 RepID=UPI000B89BA24|nr:MULTISPECIES: mitochondrial fission ELM1 family protein [unclassified Pseudoxanthomonas]PPJ41389.1 nucleoside-diphosphate sugar epimerase [Pseudoxanthomonas sp. KAs_5_3]